MLGHVRMMAAYNHWANRRLYDACSALPDADLRAGLGAFFGSLHGTLNHLLVADRIWMARLSGEPPPDLALDTILFERFAELRAAREVEDSRLAAFVGSLGEAGLRAAISYRPITRPEPVTQPLGSALAHVFNHQTHHRGQCHAMLTRVAHDAPGLDLLIFQRETGMGMAA